ncbi:ATP-binding cassette domain-containing protein [Oerskovia sp. KBS0722]|uniref:ABC transporter ATP-binding protein/permease n=1 Tax=Oerskovia sp. KBS0722 TaxID=1179673 RepID=UPI00110E759D|nr:ATP-binding cassette domain-containing protein [Oerskovia sp. KBS0722]QDW62235.1 ATP-binding cassette domain-containing protein [Oerskovia sp. KBS0722]
MALQEALHGRTVDDRVHPLIELRGITRRYANGTTALGGVDLAIGPGERVAVVGRSGSGKSTLLNVLGLLDAPDAGEVLIDGQPVDSAQDRVRAEWRSSELGFVFQRSHLIPALSVRENVLLGLRYSTASPDDADQVIADSLRAVGLEHKEQARARTLSGGEMQRVAIARTLARPARLWLADEPTGNLDSGQSLEIIEELKRRAAERGAALVVVTHEPDIAERLDRVITLHDGFVVDDTATTASAGPVGDRHAAGAPDPHRPDDPHRPQDQTRPRTRSVARLSRTARFVLQGIMSNAGRTASGTVASAVAVALTVTALGLAQSASGQVTGLFDAQRATQVTAALTTDGPNDARWPVRVDAVADFPGVTGVEHWRVHSQTPVANGALAALTVDLVSVDEAPGETTDTAVTWAPHDDRVLGEGEVLLGAGLARRLGVTQLDVSPEITVQDEPLRVVGLVTASRSGTAAGSAFVNAADADGLPVALSSSLFVETVPGAARNVADRLQDLADPFGTTRMTIAPVLEPSSFRGELQDSVAASLQVLAVVAALAGLVGVVFVNLLSVSSRTAELGVRRAFGARRSELVTLVVGECTALAVLGALVGLVTGFAAVMVVTAVARWQPIFDARLLLVPLAGALLFGIVGGLPPAVAAGRIEPADAVRS